MSCATAWSRIAHQVGAGPRHDVVFAGGHQVGRHDRLAEVPLTPSISSLPGTRRLFSRYMLRRYQAMNGPAMLVLSEFQYSRSKARGLALEVIADHVLPDEVVGAQAGEHLGPVRGPGTRPPCRWWPRAGGHRGFVDQAADLAGVGEIEQGGQRG